MTRRGASLLNQADPHLAVVRSLGKTVEPAASRDEVELARYRLYKALDRHVDAKGTGAWMSALEAAVQGCSRRPVELVRAVQELRAIVDRASDDA